MQDTGRNVAWTQDEGSLCIGVEVADDVRGKDVNLEVHPRRMKLEIQQKLVIEGPFPAAVKPDGSFFSMETADKSKLCLITLEKQEVSADRWVELFEDEELDTSITDKVCSAEDPRHWWHLQSPQACPFGVPMEHYNQHKVELERTSHGCTARVGSHGQFKECLHHAHVMQWHARHCKQPNDEQCTNTELIHDNTLVSAGIYGH